MCALKRTQLPSARAGPAGGCCSQGSSFRHRPRSGDGERSARACSRQSPAGLAWRDFIFVYMVHFPMLSRDLRSASLKRHIPARFRIGRDRGRERAIHEALYGGRRAEAGGEVKQFSPDAEGSRLKLTVVRRVRGDHDCRDERSDNHDVHDARHIVGQYAQRAISAATRGSVLIRNCVAPIRALIVQRFVITTGIGAGEPSPAISGAAAGFLRANRFCIPYPFTRGCCAKQATCRRRRH